MKRTIEQESMAYSSNSPVTSTDRRPTAVVIIALVQLIGTMIATIGGISLLLPGTFLNILWTLNPTAYRTFAGLGPVAAALLLGLGVLTFTAELGLFWRQRWSWWLTLFLLLVVGIVNVSRLVTGDPGEIFGTPLTLGLLWLHTRRNVRTFFLHNTVAV